MKTNVRALLGLGVFLLCLTGESLAATVTWTGGGDGVSWSDANNWSGNALPPAGSDVVIGVVSGNPTIQFTSTVGTAQINSLTSSEPINITGGTLQIATTFQSSQNVTLSGGTIQGGTINVGTVAGGGSLLVLTGSGGTLDGVTVNGDLDLTQVNGANLRVLDGLTLNGTMYVGAADGSTYGRVYFGDGSATPGSLTASAGQMATVLFGGAYYMSNALYDYSNGGGLTFGANVTVHGNNGSINTVYGNGSFLNQGTINADTAGGTIYVSDGTVTNTGTMTATNGGSLIVYNLVEAAGLSVTGGGSLDLEGTWANTGTVLVAGGGALTLGGTWSSSGAINANTSPVNLGGTFSLASLGTLNYASGEASLTGMLDITGQTLTLNATTGPWYLKGGTIQGGTISAGTVAGGGSFLVLTNSGGTLDGVTVNGDLDLTQVNGANLRVLDGLTLNGTMYVGAADGSTYGRVYFGDGSATPGSLTASAGQTATVVFGGAYYMSNALYDYSNGGGLTFGASVTVHGNNGSINTVYGNGSFLNQGTINADTAGGTIYINDATVTNTGTMTGTNGGSLVAYNLVEANGLSVTGGGSLDLEGTWANTGTFSVAGGGALTLGGNGWSNSGTIAITGGGALTLGGTWSSSGAINANTSPVNLGGTFSVASLATLHYARGEASLTGMLDITGQTLTLNATTGPWYLKGGTIKGGTINAGTVAGGGSFLVLTNSGGALDGVTVNGDLDLTQVNGANLRVLDGLTLNGTMYVGATDGSTYGRVFFGDGSATPGSLTASAGQTATVVFGGAYYMSNALYDYSNGGGLTFGASVTVHGNNGSINTVYGNGSFLNQGTINADTAGGTIYINDATVTNTGTMTATNGGSLTVYNLAEAAGLSVTAGGSLDLEGTWANTGTVSVAGGGALTLGGNGWTNSGTIAITGGGALTLGGTWSSSGAINANTSPVNLGGTFSLASLATLNYASGEASLTGMLDITGQTLTLNATTGPLYLKGGTIKGGTISAGTVAGGGSFLVLTNNGGTLDGVTVNGDLDLSQVNGAYLFVSNGLTLNGTMYVGAADGSTYGQVYFGDGSATPASLTASAGQTAMVLFGGSPSNYLYDYSNGGGLTFGANVTVHGNNGRISYIYGNGSFLNQGTINADTAGGTIYVSDATVTNTGTMEGTNGGSLTVYNLADAAGVSVTGGGSLDLEGTWANTGTIAITGGGALTLGGTWSSSGAINANTSPVNLGGTFSLASLATLNYASGEASLTGMLDITGQTLTLNATTGPLYLKGGTIKGGTISAGTVAGGGSFLVLTNNGGTLDGVTVNGDLDLSQVNGAYLFVSNGLTLNGTMYVGAADGSTYGQVYFGDGSATPASLTASAGQTAMVLFGGSPSNYLYDYSNGGGLTFGANVTVHGNNGRISYIYGNGSFLNQGTINADTAGGTIYVSDATVTNTGTMEGTNGGSLTVYNLADAAGVSVTGGGSLDLEGTWANTGTIAITGGGALTLGGTWSSSGAINANTSPVNLGGTFSLASLATLNYASGEASLTGMLDITGQTLTLNATTGPLYLKGGTIKGGTISAGTVAGGGSFLVLTNNGGTLDGVTVNGDLDLSQVNGAYLFVSNGLTLNGTMYVGAADGSTYGQVYFGDGSATPASLTASAGQAATVVFGGSPYNNNLYDYSYGGGLTFGANVTVHGQNGVIYGAAYVHGSFLNQGTINADTAGGTISVNDATVTNTGTMEATAGTLSIPVSLTINDPGILSSSPSGSILLGGNLLGNTTSVGVSNPQGTTALNGSGTVASPQLLEAMSQDLGAVPAGLNNNFAFGTLALGQNSYVQVVDQSHNSAGTGAEAVYTRTVIVPAGSTLDLNGLNLYAQHLEVAGTVLNGTISELPTAISIWRMQNFNISTNTGIAADTATPDHDGVPNLLKYGLVIPPGSSGTDLLPIAQVVSYADGDHLAMTFYQDPNRNDITIQVVAADSPAGPWTVVATSVYGATFSGSGFVSETAGGGALLVVEVRDPVNINSATQRYLQVMVTH